MKRTLVVCIIIIIFIIMSDLLLRKYADNKFDYMIGKLTDINNSIELVDDKPEMVSNSREGNKKIIEDLESMWEKDYTIMSCYLEHNELEKVKTQMVIIQAGMETNDVSYIYEEVNRALYIIEHIKDKSELKIDNIL